MFSNRYIYLYSAGLVIVVAVLLALAATLLQPYQQKNIEVERMQYILSACNIENNAKTAENIYKKVVIEEILVDSKGDIVGIYRNNKLEKGSKRAFFSDLKLEMKNIEEGKPASFAVFKVKHGNDTLTVFPMQGKGLWGPIWGYISLKNDLNTVAGVVFDHKGETPGLGAEISGEHFQKQFFNKQILDESGKFVSVKIIKGGVKGSKTPEIHGVDAISGGTITSNGTSRMIEKCLGLYVPYIDKNRKK